MRLIWGRLAKAHCFFAEIMLRRKFVINSAASASAGMATKTPRRSTVISGQKFPRAAYEAPAIIWKKKN